MLETFWQSTRKFTKKLVDGLRQEVREGTTDAFASNASL
jgi:hypothetical protein